VREFVPYRKSLLHELSRRGYSLCDGRESVSALSTTPRIAASRGEVVVLLHEFAAGRGLPDQPARVRMAERFAAPVSGPGVRPVVILVDASERMRLWIWWVRIGGVRVVREVREGSDPGDCGRLVRLVERELRPMDPPPAPVDAAGRAIRRQLAATLPDLSAASVGRGGVPSGRAALVRWCERGRTPVDTLRVWRALRRVRLIDVACGEGDWLLEALEELRPIYHATLQRMTGLLMDAAALPTRERAELRRLVAEAGGRALPRLAQQVDLNILLFNLQGASTDVDGVRITRLRLARAAATRGEAERHLIRRVLELRIARISADPEEQGSPEVAPGDGAVLLHQAFEILRDLHLSRRSGAAGLLFGYRELSRRITALTHGSGRSAEEKLAARFPGISRGKRTGGVAVGGAAEARALLTLDVAGGGYPVRLREGLGNAAPRRMTARGQVELLRVPSEAVFCSVSPPAELVLQGLDLACEMADAGLVCVGGFQSPTERLMLDALVRRGGRVIVCVARTIGGGTLREPLATAEREGRLLLLSVAERRRTDAALAVERNRIVAALADGVTVVHASPGGRLHGLMVEVGERGYRVRCPVHAANEGLFLLGAEGWRPGGIRAAAPASR
jgi:hypothetical protein